MYKPYFFYDENYIFTEERHINVCKIPENMTDIPKNTTFVPKNATDIQPMGFYKAKFDPETETWNEAATPEEIDAILQTGRKQEPTIGEQITQLQLALVELYEGGFVRG